MGCIYRFFCKTSKKNYIGQYKKDTYDGEWNRYVNEAKRVKNSTRHLIRAIKKYGEDDFEKYVLCICSTQDELDKKEDEYITEYKSMCEENGYNMVRGGRGRAPKFNHAEEHKLKMSELMKNRIISEDTKQKISKARKGKPTSESHKKSLAKFFEKEFSESIFPKRLEEWIIAYNKKGRSPDSNSEDVDEKRAGQWRQDMISKRFSSSRKKGGTPLNDDQIKILDNTTGWTWKKPDEFIGQFENFKIQYAKYNGKLSRGTKDPAHIERHRAAIWVNAMRTKKRKNHLYLTPERIKMLEECEFWSWVPVRNNKH